MTRQHAFTLVEVVVSMAIVSVMFLAVMTSVGKSGQMQLSAARRAQAHSLAESLMAEILALPYVDPSGSAPIGLDTGESATRTTWDDVDDYNGLSATPPTTRAGATLPGLTNWTTAVLVQYVNPTDLASIVGSDQGVKRITVTISHSGVDLVRHAAIRTSAWQGGP